MPVYYPISAYDKIAIEAPYHALTNAGHISYIEMDGDPTENLGAFERVIRCMKEIDALATAMGIPFLVDIEKTNLDILDALVPEASTSMQRDIWAGKPSEIDGLLYEPLRLGQQYGVEMPNYEMIVKVLKEKYGE